MLRGSIAWSLALGLALFVGCTTPLDPNFDSGVDAPRMDVPSVSPDAIDTPADTMSPDATAIDAPTTDSLMRDTRMDMPLDAPRDVPSDLGRDAPMECNALFGMLPGYVLCAERPGECEFFVTMMTGGGSDCRSVCDSASAECLDAYRTVAPGSCMRGGHTACGAGASSMICVCRI